MDCLGFRWLVDPRRGRWQGEDDQPVPRRGGGGAVDSLKGGGFSSIGPKSSLHYSAARLSVYIVVLPSLCRVIPHKLVVTGVIPEHIRTLG